MIKKICFLVVAFACVVLAHQIPLWVYKEGGSDHVYFNGKMCRVLTHPLNDFIAKHYAEWPFRPINACTGLCNRPIFAYFGPKNGGGYTAFWSFQDSALYLDSVKINACSRSLYTKSDDQRVVSVSIPPQEIVLNTSAEKRTFKSQNSEPLFADFVSDTIKFECESGYSSYVKEGRVVSEPRKTVFEGWLIGGTKPIMQRNSKRMNAEPDSLSPNLYQEGNSPFVAYYKVLDSLRQVLDDKGMEVYLEESRIDPRFKKFEDFFKINAISTWYYDSMHEADDRYVFYVSPKGKTPFKEIIFRLRKYETFEKDPVESIKLFLRTLIAIRKNPSFEKWLNYKRPFMNFQDIAIVREDEINVLVEPTSRVREKIWSDVGMKGEYVATIRYRDNDLPQYEFWLSDNGDVLVTFAFVPNMEEFFNIENFKINRFGRTYSVEPRIERCEGFDSKKNSLRDGYCNYLIIRHDGTIEYGPKSGNL